MQDDLSGLIPWLALNQINGLGPVHYRKLLQAYGSPLEVFERSAAQLQSVLPPELAAAVAAGVDEERLRPTITWLSQSNNSVVTLTDADYPQLLLHTPDPPPILYVKGSRDKLNAPAIAVVGSRNATAQGLKDARAFAQTLSDNGLLIVSGLALGIDGAAHAGGLAGPAKTIAVCGTGLDVVYPARHRALAHEIAEAGALISEFPLTTPAKAHNFPRRNRIISGMTLGCIVIEAARQSGSLITARLAAEQGRDVFALPGSIHSPLSRGCHDLIKQGAKLVESAQDILEELRLGPKAGTPNEASGDSHPLLQHLGYSAIDIDTLVAHSGLAIETLSGMLLSLELEGRIAVLPGGLYQRLF
mgnify:FL=1